MKINLPFHIEIEINFHRTRYYEIIGSYTGDVIGWCTDKGIESVKAEEPRAILREISKRKWEKHEKST